MTAVDPATQQFLVTSLDLLRITLIIAVAGLTALEAFYEKKIPRLQRSLRRFWVLLRRSDLQNLFETTMRSFVRGALLFTMMLLSKAWKLYKPALNIALCVLVSYYFEHSIVFWVMSGLILLSVVEQIAFRLVSVKQRIGLFNDTFSRLIVTKKEERDEEGLAATLSTREAKISLLIGMFLGNMLLLKHAASFFSIFYLLYFVRALQFPFDLFVGIALLPVFATIGSHVGLVIMALVFIKNPRVTTHLDKHGVLALLAANPDEFTLGLRGAYFVTLVFFSVMFLSVPLSVIGYSIGSVTAVTDEAELTLRLLLVNMLSDGTTIVLTIVLFLWALSRNPVFRFIPVVVLDLLAASLLPILSIYLGVIGGPDKIGLSEAMNILFGRSPDGSEIRFGQLFWVMHSSLIPSLVYLVTLLGLWSANVFVLVFMFFFGRLVVLQKNPLKVLAAFLGLWLAAIEVGLRLFGS